LTDLIVADAGPLIGLARTDYLWVLKHLFGRVLIPSAVLNALQIDATRPGSRALSRAMKSGWLLIAEPPPSQKAERLAEILDDGEAEAILLAQAPGRDCSLTRKEGESWPADED
jgi:predicted nucleic acid-binding protein